MKNFTKKSQGLLLRFDDIAQNMNWKFMNKCEVMFDKNNIKPLVGVIPNNKDPELLNYEKEEKFWDRLKIWQEKGWEICMHGYTHIYDNETNKKDFFNYGGRSEFYGHSFDEQSKRIIAGLNIFKNRNIKIRSFFAPNHTYDENTFLACKQNGIEYIIDGYAFYPYKSKGLTFIPQLFYKEIMLPYGVQATQIHLNYWDEKKFKNFEMFIKKNSYKFLDLNEAASNIKNNIFSLLSNYILRISLKFLRFLRN